METVLVGDVILRHVTILSDNNIRPTYSKMITPMEITKSNRGVTMFRARRSKVVQNRYVVLDKLDQGLVCFCEKEITDKTTHFIVTKVMRGGSSVNVEPIEGDMEDLKNEFPTPPEVVSLVEHTIQNNPRLVCSLISIQELKEHLSKKQIEELCALVN